MSSWDAAAKWYSALLGEKGHYYHESVVWPNALRLLNLQPAMSLLDLGCGPGIFARYLPEPVMYCGVDLSKNMIEEAKRKIKRSSASFVVGDVASKKLRIEKTDFDRACMILSLQNMEHGATAVLNAARHLKTEGKLLLVLNHPCFRIPRQSGWGVDEQAKLQYRRVNRYLSPLQIPLQIHPGKGEKSEIFYSYHHPISEYAKWLSANNFCIESIEEWRSDKRSEGPKARMEDRSREEIPLFLALVGALRQRPQHLVT